LNSGIPLPDKNDYAGSNPGGDLKRSGADAASNTLPPNAQAAPPIPDHALLRRIGRGSYGEVWLARNMMGVCRAVKIVYRKSFEDQRPFERELSGIRKFEPISRSHEGFIDVLHVGMNEKGEYFYYVMELGDDERTGIHIDPDQYHPKTLARTLAVRGKLSYQACLQLGLDLSRALSELHRNGLVHRDVKPSNIIFVSGVPKLADIGLVAGTEEARSYVGTEGFIPPEGPGTPRADVYALGKVLYEAITGKDRQDYPELPAEWDETPDAHQLLEFNEVLLHACSADIAQCYKSAEEMHADLVVLLNGKSVRRLKSLERQLSRLKRIGATLALMTVFLAAISFMIYRELTAAAKAREGQVRANIAYGNQAMGSGDLLSALPYFSAAMYLDKGNQHREMEQQVRFGSVLAQCPKLVQMFFRSNEVESVSLSPNGRHVLIVEDKRRAQIFDVTSGNAVTRPFGQSSGLRRGAYSTNGELVVTASEDGTACLWRSSDGTKIACLPHPAEVLSATFSPDGRHVVTGCADSQAWIWTTTTYSNELKLIGHTDAVVCVAYSHNGKLIATASRDSTARIWDASSGIELRSFPHPNWVQFVAFGPDDRTLLTGCDDHYGRVWDVEADRRIPPKLAHHDVVMSGDMSPDGRYIITGSLDGSVQLWSTEDHVPHMPVPVLWHSDRVTAVAFGSDGHRIVSGCVDGTVRVWDLAGSEVIPQSLNGIFSKNKEWFLTITNNDVLVLDTLSQRLVSRWIRPSGRLNNAALSDNGRFVLTLSLEGEETNAFERVLRAWDSKSGIPLGPSISDTNAITTLRISDDGKRLLSFGTNFIQTWDVEHGKLLAQTALRQGQLKSALLNPAGNLVVSWSDSKVNVWGSADFAPSFLPLTHSSPIQDVEFSPNGHELVACCADSGYTKCYAQVWDMVSGEPVGYRLAHGDGVLSVAFSPDGSRIVTGGEDSKAMVWKAATSERIAVMPHENQVLEVCFDPDGKWIASASSDGTARVWSVETQDPLTPPLWHHSGVFGAKFVADNYHLVTSDDHGNAWIWHLPHETRPVEDLIRLSRLLSGDRAAQTVGLGRPHSETLEETWVQLRTRYPSQFQVSDQDVAAWHEFEAKESELHEQWSGAVFHLQQLLRMRPGDQLIEERVRTAQANTRTRN
jgi:WD40 repeat protein